MPATSPPLFVGLVVAVPKAPALVGCGNPIRLRRKLDMLIVEEKIRIAAMPVANARIIELGDDVWEGGVYLVGDIRLWLNSKNDVDEGWAVAHRDHLSRNYHRLAAVGVREAVERSTLPPNPGLYGGEPWQAAPKTL